MDPIPLQASNGALSISPGDQEWAQVALHQGGDPLPLGADVLKLIAAKLVAFLRLPSRGPTWVLSLSELHFSIYGEYVDNLVLLRVQDAAGRMVATLELTREQQHDWVSCLASFST